MKMSIGREAGFPGRCFCLFVYADYLRMFVAETIDIDVGITVCPVSDCFSVPFGPVVVDLYPQSASVDSPQSQFGRVRIGCGCYARL